MVHEDHPMAEKVELLKESMQLRWDNLKQLSQGHEEKLGESLKAKQVGTKKMFSMLLFHLNFFRSEGRHKGILLVESKFYFWDLATVLVFFL